MEGEGKGRYTGGTALLNNTTNLHGQFEKFMRACRSGDVHILNEIYVINKRILQSRAAFGSTAVHIVGFTFFFFLFFLILTIISNCMTHLSSSLLKTKQNTHFQNIDPPQAAENGKISTLEWLRERGADFAATTRPRNQTPLHFAAARGQVITLKWLCEHAQALGCVLEAKDYRKRTATQLATQYGFHEAATVLDNAKRIPMQTKLHRTQFGEIWGDGEVSTWESYTRDQLIEGLSDLRQLHESELKSRTDREEQQFIEISSLKSELTDVRLQVSELKELVDHLVQKDRESIEDEMVARLEESNRSTLTIGGIRVETAHLSASTKQWKEEETSRQDREGKESTATGVAKESELQSELQNVEKEETGKEEEGKETDSVRERVVEEVPEPKPEPEMKQIQTRPSTTESVKEAEAGWGEGLEDDVDGSWSTESGGHK